MRLNIPSGNRPIPGFTGVDLAPGADVVCDMRKLPEEWTDAVEEIRSIHGIEHINYWEVGPMLAEWRRVLRPGGRLYIECPNAIENAAFLLQDPENPIPMRAFYGNPEKREPLQLHRWGYTPASLIRDLQMAGFRNAKQVPVTYKTKIPKGMAVEAFK